MTEANNSSTSKIGLAQEEDVTAYQAFHLYQWDLDKDFLVSTVPPRIATPSMRSLI